MLKTWIYSILLAITALNLSAQESIYRGVDSIKLIADAMEIDTNKVRFYLDAAQEIKPKNKYYAIYFASQAFTLSLDINNQKQKAYSSLKLGQLYREVKEFGLSLEYLNKSRSLYDSLNLGGKLSLVLLEIGVLYSDVKKHKIAISYYEKSLVLSRVNNLVKLEGMALNNLGVSHGYLSNYTKAINCFNQANEIAENTNMIYGKALCAFNIGECNAKFGKLNEALESFALSLALSSKLNLQNNMASCYIELAKIYLRQNKHRQAENELKKADKILDKVNDIELSLILNETFFSLYQVQEKYHLALTYSHQASELNNQLMNKKKIKLVEELSAKNENVRREKRITLLQKEKQLNKAWNYILIILFFLLLIFAIIISLEFEQRKQRKEQEWAILQALKTEEELKMLQAKINPHFLYNALNSIASLVEDQPINAQTMIYDLAAMFKFSINPFKSHFSRVDESIELVKRYLKIEKSRFGSRLHFQFEVQESTKPFLLPRFLLQPIVENAIKHGISNLKKGVITVRISKRLNRLTILVMDNGPDFPEAFIQGYGSQNIRDKLEILYKGRYAISYLNKPDKKVRIVIDKPYLEEPKKFEL